MYRCFISVPLKTVDFSGVGGGQVLIDDAISSVELVNCQRMEVQIRGSVPSVAVDKTDGFLCYLGKESLGTNFVTSKVCFSLHVFV